jgi:hypothetical protein
MLLFKLFELGQIPGHNVQVNAFNGVLSDEPGQVPGHNVQVNVFDKVLGGEPGQKTTNSIKSSFQTHCQSPTSQPSTKALSRYFKPT